MSFRKENQVSGVSASKSNFTECLLAIMNYTLSRLPFLLLLRLLPLFILLSVHHLP